MAVSAAYLKRWGKVGSCWEFSPSMRCQGTFVLVFCFLKKHLDFRKSLLGLAVRFMLLCVATSISTYRHLGTPKFVWCEFDHLLIGE